MAPEFRSSNFVIFYLSTLLKFCLLSLKKWKGREGRRNRIATTINVVPGGEFSHVYLCGVGSSFPYIYVWGGEGGGRRKNVSGKHDIH